MPAVNHQIYTDDDGIQDEDFDDDDADDGDGGSSLNISSGGRSPQTDNGSFRGWTGQ